MRDSPATGPHPPSPGAHRAETACALALAVTAAGAKRLRGAGRMSALPRAEADGTGTQRRPCVRRTGPSARPTDMAGRSERQQYRHGPLAGAARQPGGIEDSHDASEHVQARQRLPRNDREDRRRVHPRLARADAGGTRIPQRADDRARRHGLRAVRLLRQSAADAPSRRAGGRMVCSTTTCTPRRCARRRVPASSPAATIMPTAWPRSPRWPPDTPATTATSRSRTDSCPRCCWSTATTRTCSASGTSCPRNRSPP